MEGTMKIEWVREDEVPAARTGHGPRDIGQWSEMAKTLRANPGKWALVSESLGSSRITYLRHRFPDIEFRTQLLTRSGDKPSRVWACANGGHDKPDPTVQVSLTLSQIQALLGKVSADA